MLQLDIKEEWKKLPERLKTLWRKRLSWKELFWYGLVGGSGLLLTLLVFCLAVRYGAFGPLPTYGELRDIRNNVASEVYATDGVLLGKFYKENRVNADFEEISTDMVNALVATEDARFFQHSGVDPRAMARVALRTVLMADRSGGGGSTISQQLAKNLFGRDSYGLLSIPVNKIQEMFIARRLEKIYTKADLLRLYLNTVPFGDIYGVKVAAQRFFNKSPQELRVEEAAVLIGMLKGNTLYHPVNRPDNARDRRNVVLKQMARYGYLDPAVVDSLQQLPLKVEYYREGHNRGLATYFRAHIEQQAAQLIKDLQKEDGTPYNLKTDGLRIYTTIDSRLQRYAEEAVQENMPRLQENLRKDWGKNAPWNKPELLKFAMQQSPRYQQLKARGASEDEIKKIFDKPVKMQVFSWEEPDKTVELSPMDSIRHYLQLLNTGLLALDPETGAVRAWVGGIDHGYFQYDHVKAKRQVGSTFKPIVYLQAMLQGRNPCDYIPSRLTTYSEHDNWQPRNADNKYEGYYSLAGALSNSVNTVAAELILEAGIDSVRHRARQMGVESELPEGPAIALGAVDASLLEMCRVYATIANNGKRPELYYIQRIESSTGDVLVDTEIEETEAFPQVVPDTANTMLIELMRTVVDSGTARKLRYQYGLYGDMAGKTGTTQDQSDGWFIGFTPKLVAGVWVGASLPAVHFRTLGAGQGGSTALPIWGTFMKKVMNDPDYRSWQRVNFPALSDSLALQFDCPLYLEEIPLADELMDEYQENPGFFDRLYRELLKQDDDDEHQAPIQLKPRRPDETQEEYLERMRRYNQRLERRDERREQLKEFWNNKLFGKKKSG